ncbi:MAG: hypothetical protein NZT92_08610 [Abditibacteriales bacterium]|nr:hypothetical protein [Abditibacteriales bacterium]MDW8366049.1 hypothetical protein [Abditibacteriales bacterium]
MSVEDLWNPYKREQPRFRRPKIYYVVVSLVLMVAAGVLSSVMILRSQQPTMKFPLSGVTLGEPLPVTAYDMGDYVVENARAVWKGEIKEYETADPVDYYEVTGRIRRKHARAPSHLTLKVEMRVGIVRVTTEQCVVSGVGVDQPKPFTCRIKDATHARLRKADLNFVISPLLSSPSDED